MFISSENAAKIIVLVSRNHSVWIFGGNILESF